MNRLYGNDPTPVRFNTQKYLQGGRVGLKPGGLVEPGVVHYGKSTANLLKADQKLLQKLITEANAGNKFTTVEDINKLYYEAKGVDRGAVTYPGSTSKFRPSKTLSIRANPIFHTLDTREEKVEKVFKEMLMDKNPLPEAARRPWYKEGQAHKSWRLILMDKTGISSYKKMSEILSKSPTFKAIAPEANFLSTGMGGYKEMYEGLPFSEQLKTAAIQMEGKPVFTGLSKNKVRLLSPNYTVMRVALENWHANKGKGAIKFFDKNGDKITWGEKKGFPIHESSFSYKGKKYNYKKLLEPGVGKKAFPEVFRVQNAIQKLSNRVVNNPFKKGEKINFKDLVKEVQVRGYKWSPKAPIHILHGIEGVKNKPFTDLSFSTKDINLLENAVMRSTKSPEFKKAAINELYKDLKGLGDDEISDLIVKRQTGLAKTIVSGKEIPSVIQQKEEIFKLLKTAKTTKGPAKVKAVTKMIAILGSGKLADEVLKEQGISLTQDENEKVLEAGMLPNVIKEHPITSAAVAGTTLRASKRLPGDPLKVIRKAVHTPVTWPLKKIIRSIGTPLSGAGFAGWRIHDELKAGKSLTDAVVDPIVGAELAFPSLFKENISKIIPDKYQNVAARAGRKILGLGKVGSRFMGPVGVAIGAAGSVYDAYKDYERRKEFLTPERKREAQKESFDKDEPMFKSGGKVDYDNYLPGIDDDK